MDVTYDELPFGFSWLPDEALTRTAHALDTGDGVWLVDPVDVPEAIERATALGKPAGVLQLLDRHNRDCAQIAARLGVPHLRLPAAIPGSPFRVVPVLELPRWREIALWWPERRVLVVAELIGTNRVHALGSGRAGGACARVRARAQGPSAAGGAAADDGASAGGDAPLILSDASPPPARAGRSSRRCRADRRRGRGA